MSKTPIDPVIIAVIGNRLDAITKEIGETMLRTSRSPIFSEARDFVTSMFDRHCRLIAQTHYIPVIGASTPFGQRAIAEAFGDDIHEGDVFILNDPYRGNNHPPDITITRPVFWEGKLCYWAMAKGHHADVGGGGVVGYNPASRDIWDEALVLPPLKLVERGRLRSDVFGMILANVRVPFLVDGDLKCQIGATAIGERGLKGLLAKYGMETLDGAIEEILSASDAQVRREIARIPDGIYTAERRIDHDGIDKDKMPLVKVTMTVAGDTIDFDFTGSNPQVRGFLNSPIANTVGATHLALFACMNPDIRYNDGAGRAVTVVAPQGSIVNPLPPAPTTACTVPTAETICEVCWLALAQAIPGQAQAPWARWCAPATMGIDPRTGRFFADIHFISKGGGGATEGYDGWDHIGTVVCLGGVRSPDPELHELVSPYRLLDYEYQPDSAGAGQWRGGFGVTYRWEVLADGIPCANFGSGVRPETAPVGIAGGHGAPPYRLRLVHSDGSTQAVDCNSFYTLNKGDVFEISSSGGGGFGDPRLRPVAKVLADIRDGLVSPRMAASEYGVIVDPATLAVDDAATARARG